MRCELALDEGESMDELVDQDVADRPALVRGAKHFVLGQFE